VVGHDDLSLARLTSAPWEQAPAYQVVGGAHPLDGHLVPHDLVGRLARDLAAGFGVDGAGRDGIDPDAERSELVGELLGDALTPTLASP